MKANLHTHPIPGFTSVNVQERKDLGIRAGDTVKVSLKIKEKAKGKKGEEKIRIQIFEGIVLAAKHGAENGATFTVRKVSNGVGIERIFPLYSPVIDKIEIVKRAKVRQSKLYHLRDKVAKDIKRQLRKTTIMGSATLSDAEYQDMIAAELVAAEEADTAEAAQADADAVAAELGEEAPVVETPVEESTEEVVDTDSEDEAKD